MVRCSLEEGINYPTIIIINPDYEVGKHDYPQIVIIIILGVNQKVRCSLEGGTNYYLSDRKDINLVVNPANKQLSISILT